LRQLQRQFQPQRSVSALRQLQLQMSERLAATSATAIVPSAVAVLFASTLQQQQQHCGDIGFGVCKAAAAAARRKHWKQKQQHALADSFQQHGAVLSATCPAEAAQAAALSGSLQ